MRFVFIDDNIFAAGLRFQLSWVFSMEEENGSGKQPKIKSKLPAR